MNLPAEIFRAYDIRGIAGRTLTPEIVRAIGRALGAMAPRYAVGRDGRHSGTALAAALAQGMNEAGADTVDRASPAIAHRALGVGDFRRQVHAHVHLVHRHRPAAGPCAPAGHDALASARAPGAHVGRA